VNPDIEIENRSHFHEAKKYPLAVLSSMRGTAGRVIFGSVGRGDAQGERGRARSAASSAS
jgi:hypothetical protein